MKRFIYPGALMVLIASVAALLNRAEGQTPGAAGSDPHRAMLNAYCLGCHNARLKTGGLSLDGLDLQAPAGDAQIWEKALRKLRGRLMPPPGSPQPSEKDIDSFTAWMENKLDSQAKGPKAGYVTIQRLNRTEYAATVKALVGVEVKATDVLPQDIQVGGFDNIATALNVSPSFLDQYVTTARQVAKLAVGSPNPRVSNVKYSVAANQNPDQPLPLGTRGGVRFKHNFPADGEYHVTMTDLGAGLYTGPLENESTLIGMIDGKIVFRKTIGGPVRAGELESCYLRPAARFPQSSGFQQLTNWQRKLAEKVWLPTLDTFRTFLSDSNPNYSALEGLLCASPTPNRGAVQG